MSYKDFITIGELKERLQEVITKNDLPYNVDLIMREIEKKVADGDFDEVDRLNVITIKGYKNLRITGQLLNGEVVFTHVAFQGEPKVFISQQFPLGNC